MVCCPRYKRVSWLYVIGGNVLWQKYHEVSNVHSSAKRAFLAFSLSDGMKLRFLMQHDMFVTIKYSNLPCWTQRKASLNVYFHFAFLPRAFSICEQMELPTFLPFYLPFRRLNFTGLKRVSSKFPSQEIIIIWRKLVFLGKKHLLCNVQV